MSDELREELAKELQWKVPNRRERELADELLPWLKRKILEARIEECGHGLAKTPWNRALRIDALKRELESLK